MEKTKHGYEIYPANKFHKYEQLYCRDDETALEDIRELLMQGRTIEAVNDYDTFYGCGWGHWLIEGTKDIANAEVTEKWNPGYYCDRPFPKNIVLTPIK